MFLRDSDFLVQSLLHNITNKGNKWMKSCSQALSYTLRVAFAWVCAGEKIGKIGGKLSENSAPAGKERFLRSLPARAHADDTRYVRMSKKAPGYEAG